MTAAPGPWEEHYGDVVATVNGEPYVVCRADWRVSGDDPQWKADAKLIAAAPEMLRLLLDVHREGWVGTGMTLDVEIGDLLHALTGGAAGYPPTVD